VRFLALLAASILVNFSFGCALVQAVNRQQSVKADWAVYEQQGGTWTMRTHT
jgi:hypothetical protein